jgi:Tol biopolymer transport system component
MDLRERLQQSLGSRYALERELGQGGMSTVFLAEDPRHRRQVAIKVLRPELAAALGPERFSREIQIAARLQHPHILPLLDSGEADGFLYYVMPYVEGQSLRDRLAREGELPLHDAVRIMVEIVDALAHAHGRGVVHRDIKPDNVLLSGRHALVMDFGVAKAVSEATGRQNLTTAGVALGTPAYMAPEQATADPALDHRVDIYAVGIVGYELLTGRTPFAGLTPQQTLAAHVAEPPPAMARFRPSVPPALEAVIMRCLAKHPADRWQTADELMTQLEPLRTPSGGMTPAETRPVAALPVGRGSRLRVFALLGALAVLGGRVAIFAAQRRSAEALALGRRTQVTLEPGLEIDPALSPDGRFIAYASGALGRTRIVVRQLEGSGGGGSGNTIPITGGTLANVRQPRWSPDGSRIAYASPRGIEVVPALGGQSRMIAEAVAPDTASDVTWSPDGKRIAYRMGDTLYSRASDGSGSVTRVAAAFEPHSPAWSPDGRWITFVSGNRWFVLSSMGSFGNIAPSRLMIVPAAGGTPVPLTDGSSLNVSPAWLPGRGELVFVSNRDGGRDLYHLRLDGSGHPAGVPERLSTGINAAAVSVSADGRRLAYSAFNQRANVFAVPLSEREPLPISRARQVTVGNQVVEGFDVSPDLQWLAYDTDRNGNQDVYKVRLAGGEPEQLTNDPSDDFANTWSPDGREIAFHTFRNGNRDIYAVPASGGEPRTLVVSPAQERDGFWSPDGQRFFFASNRSGRYELYSQLRRGDGWGRPVRLTDDGGIYCVRSPDGKLILFLHHDRLAVVASGGGKTTDLVFRGPIAGREREALVGTWAPDGRAVLLVLSPDSTGGQQIWSLPLGSGAPRPVVRVDDPGLFTGRGPMIARGETLYFQVLRLESDIWTVEVARRH